jgi:hypothetical protein
MHSDNFGSEPEMGRQAFCKDGVVKVLLDFRAVSEKLGPFGVGPEGERV